MSSQCHTSLYNHIQSIIITLVGDGRCVFQMFLPGQEILAQRRVVDSNQLPVGPARIPTNKSSPGIRGFVGEPEGEAHPTGSGYPWSSQRLGQRREESLNCWNLMKFELVSVPASNSTLVRKIKPTSRIRCRRPSTARQWMKLAWWDKRWRSPSRRRGLKCLSHWDPLGLIWDWFLYGHLSFECKLTKVSCLDPFLKGRQCSFCMPKYGPMTRQTELWHWQDGSLTTTQCQPQTGRIHVNPVMS